MELTDYIALVALAVSTAVGASQWRQWNRSHEIDRRMLELEEKARHNAERAALKASLDLRLRHAGPRTFNLLVHNLGEHDALRVIVKADSSNGPFRELGTFPTIASGTESAIVFTNYDWQVIGGSRLACTVSWTDGEGEHVEQELVATVR